jgi:DNA-binding NarL/FixJ family response regulator
MVAVPVRVFLLDDHELVRQGVRDLLWAQEDVTVVGDAATAEEALERIPQTKPEVAVLDVRLGDDPSAMNGIEVCRDIRSNYPEVACVMLTSFADDEALFASIMAGAAGFVLKQIRGSDLVTAISPRGRRREPARPRRHCEGVGAAAHPHAPRRPTGGPHPAGTPHSRPDR